METTVLETFDRWKAFLEERVEQAKKAGMSEDTIADLAFQIGDFLEERVDPKNGESRLLKELWDIGTEEERRMIARLMVKLVDK